ncbi:lebercilin-like protein isoform X5 [Tympanuchus pallidicinctus]|uniref:lebercilin-like protein isoform X5 n=1 Tax=Tympanuchus pallidicinctus TaxID=109042 RepID=UPI0022873681|nr:lebercilin-like protein isoform X5 [Tympanuchus pallidicinctus]
MARPRLRLPACPASAARPHGNGGTQRPCRRIASPSKYVTQTIPQSTEVLEAAAEAEVMIASNAVENAEVKIIKLTILRALSVTCSETARSSRCLELPETEEKKMQKNERKKKKEQQIFSQNNKGGKKLPAKKIPHQNSSFLSLQNNMISQKRNKVAQRILSARLHKIKELKNEIFDLQRKLEASNLENQVLKRLWYRHSKAIGGYENSESVLPDLLTRHYSESLEKQMKLNNSTFSRQLANENKKAVEAGIITKNLQMEINSLHQKIKEKDRQLYIKNIYANRLLRMPKDKDDSVPHNKSKGLSINTSVQVHKQHFTSLLSQYQPQEKEESTVLLHEEEKASEDKNQKAKASKAYTDAKCETEKQPSKKIPKPENFGRTHGEYLKENKPQTAHTCLEFVKQERKRDFLKQKKAEETLLNDSVKENSQEEDAVEEKEKKSGEQLRRGKAGSNFLIPRNKMLSKLKKQYVFSETTENLYHGLPTSGTKSTKSSLCNNRHSGQDHCKEESKVKKLSGLHEPSFSKVTNIRQKDSLTEAEGCAHTIFRERKKSLMKELFGQGNVCKDSHSCSNTRGMERKL